MGAYKGVAALGYRAAGGGVVSAPCLIFVFLYTFLISGLLVVTFPHIKCSLTAPLLLPVPTAKHWLCYCPLSPSYSSSGSFPSCHHSPIAFLHSPPPIISCFSPCSSLSVPPLRNFFTCYFVFLQLTTYLPNAVSNLQFTVSSESHVAFPNS